MTDGDGEAMYSTVARAIDALEGRGFTERFRVVDGALQALGSGETLHSRDLVIRDYYRFEGVSDPDDMAIVYAVESRSGVRGTLVDAFGVYSDAALSAVLREVPIARRAE
jgi:hypothetical protein